MKWLREQVSGVADRMEEVQWQVSSQAERLLVTTKELRKAWAQIRCLKEELKRAKECAAIMANRGQTTSVVTEPVPPTTLQKEAPGTEAQPVVSTTPEKVVEREKELLTLREELPTHEALRE